MVLLNTISKTYDKLFIDENSHYSMLDAAILAQIPFYTFSHIDPKDLSLKIKQYTDPNSRILVLTDGVFSITGSIAPLDEYHEILAGTKNGGMLIDDAHGVGVIGDNGRGILEYFGLEKNDQYHLVGTMSKAFGSHGGFISGTETLINQLRNNSKILTGTTKLPYPTVFMSIAALEYLLENQSLIQKIQENAIYFKEQLNRIGISHEITPSGIAGIHSLPNIDLKELQNFLNKRKILANYVPDHEYCGIPQGGCIKFTIFSNHSIEQLDNAVNQIATFLDK